MTKGKMCWLAMAALLGLSAGGCYRKAMVGEPVVMAPAAPVVVAQPPPAVREERMGTAPSAAHVWVPGFWTFRNQRWVWIPGHWEAKPTPSAVYVPGAWQKTASGWVYTPGRWQ